MKKLKKIMSAMVCGVLAGCMTLGLVACGPAAGAKVRAKSISGIRLLFQTEELSAK